MRRIKVSDADRRGKAAAEERRRVSRLPCDKTGNARHCDGQDVKYVQLKSAPRTPGGPNVYEGPVVLMCAGCRRAHNGTFKFPTNGS